MFDGTILTLLGKDANRYVRVDAAGSIDHLIDELRETYGLVLPAADLLMSNAYDELMSTVIDVKDLGSGMVGGVECDWLAFRTEEVDWQIWIAQGERPYPCRYVITTKRVAHSPQYTIQVRDWRTGDQVPVCRAVLGSGRRSVRAPARGIDTRDFLRGGRAGAIRSPGGGGRRDPG